MATCSSTSAIVAFVALVLILAVVLYHAVGFASGGGPSPSSSSVLGKHQTHPQQQRQSGHISSSSSPCRRSLDKSACFSADCEWDPSEGACIDRTSETFVKPKYNRRLRQPLCSWSTHDDKPALLYSEFTRSQNAVNDNNNDATTGASSSSIRLLDQWAAATAWGFPKWRRWHSDLSFDAAVPSPESSTKNDNVKRNGHHSSSRMTSVHEPSTNHGLYTMRNVCLRPSGRLAGYKPSVQPYLGRCEAYHALRPNPFVERWQSEFAAFLADVESLEAPPTRFVTAASSASRRPPSPPTVILMPIGFWHAFNEGHSVTMIASLMRIKQIIARTTWGDPSRRYDPDLDNTVVGFVMMPSLMRPPSTAPPEKVSLKTPPPSSRNGSSSYPHPNDTPSGRGWGSLPELLGGKWFSLWAGREEADEAVAGRRNKSSSQPINTRLTHAFHRAMMHHQHRQSERRRRGRRPEGGGNRNDRHEENPVRSAWSNTTHPTMERNNGEDISFSSHHHDHDIPASFSEQLLCFREVLVWQNCAELFPNKSGCGPADETLLGANTAMYTMGWAAPRDATTLGRLTEHMKQCFFRPTNRTPEMETATQKKKKKSKKVRVVFASRSRDRRLVLQPQLLAA